MNIFGYYAVLLVYFNITEIHITPYGWIVLLTLLSFTESVTVTLKEPQSEPK